MMASGVRGSSRRSASWGRLAVGGEQERDRNRVDGRGTDVGGAGAVRTAEPYGDRPDEQTEGRAARSVTLRAKPVRSAIASVGSMNAISEAHRAEWGTLMVTPSEAVRVM
jgi:hypothetical protein